MHDREFEKQVNQKMQELHFAPSPEVWARVEADIQKKKRRRPVIFWFLFAGLLTAGAGVWFAQGWNEKKGTKGTSVEHTPAVIENNRENKKKESSVLVTVVSQQKIFIQKKQQAQKTSTTEPSTKEIPASDEIIAVEQQQPKPAVDQQDTATKQQAGIAMNNTPAEEKKKDNKSKKKNSLQFGISAGAGISDVGAQLLKGSRVADFAYANSNATPNYNPPRPSEINPNTAFQIGGYASKAIGKKFSVKLGLNYEYYSTSINVGSLYNSPRAVNQGSNMRMVDQFYTTGNSGKYTNKYHFVSLPVSLQLKIADSKRTGLVWESGINASRLISATALIYDGISGTYYTDNDQFNKTQWSVSSSLLLSVKSKNLQFYAGPQVQYGISNLVSGTDSHLRYVGLKLMTTFNKK